MAHLEWLNGETKTKKILLTQLPDLQYLVTVTDDPGMKLTTKKPEDYLAAILWINGRWVLLSPPLGRAISVNKIQIVGLKILSQGNQIQLADHELRFIAIKEEILTAESSLLKEGKACPVCLTNFAVGDEVIYCPKCELAHHVNCWYEAGSCASYPFCGHEIPEEEKRSVTE